MITLKSGGDGLTIVLSDGPWSKVLAELALELERPRAIELFRGQKVRIETGERALTALQVEELAWLLELQDMQFEWGNNGTQAHLPQLEPPRLQFPPPLPQAAQWEDAALCPRTLRSGQIIRYAGHVVVIGDVNPGAEIVAAGDVVVWGHLRGVVHAGASGNDTAMVCALVLSPMQLRIGNFIGRAPDEISLILTEGAAVERTAVRLSERPSRGPEVARVRDGRITIEVWNLKE